MRRQISLAIVLMAVAGAASAAAKPNPFCGTPLAFLLCPAPVNPSPTGVKVPEIDPSAAIAGMSLLVGGLAVLRGRRANNSAK